MHWCVLYTTMYKLQLGGNQMCHACKHKLYRRMNRMYAIKCMGRLACRWRCLSVIMWSKILFICHLGRQTNSGGKEVMPFLIRWATTGCRKLLFFVLTLLLAVGLAFPPDSALPWSDINRFLHPSYRSVTMRLSSLPHLLDNKIIYYTAERFFVLFFTRSG